ncbi:AraC family transcriptional regulator [Clostridium carboxidivorans P7]|uniref:Transcriptional regulator, AraC family n=1 Tax=Clostridium carboxidivorans P7 TaxID=536227 RepID=C6PZR6_9CLOT|nr:Ada metal-binding domain-containing protein [Clostridium carboxidivorans]AKN32626.1 AraC family transcriptional regulator [Clostridium carboxidivorans P7]EET85266.1 transcriptional regulator, AraC family [Clostridium carboxidivorans P7]EFG90155.1 transcriptional regulator, AraC family [Clostridium carboxidivorans P7]
MNERTRISDNEKWQAVINCARNYDSLFFYGVKTTGIFCRPSCKSKTPIRGNVIFFNNAANAIASGFRPCKRCCPDKIIFKPELEIIKKAKDIFHTTYNKQVNLQYVSRQLGVSINHLIKLFKQHTDFTPIQYISKIRVDKAKELLKQGDISILEIAYATGYKSLSNFYKCFKDQTGYTPSEYKKSRGEL